jgi:hypothetical protein
MWTAGWLASARCRGGVYCGGTDSRSALPSGSRQAIGHQCVCGANVALPISKSNDFSPGCRLEGRVLLELQSILCTTVEEKGGARVSVIPLTVLRELRKLGLLLKIAPSSNGKTADSGSAYRGSNPCGAATALSSNGLGRGPLKAEIRVRFPLRLPSRDCPPKNLWGIWALCSCTSHRARSRLLDIDYPDEPE